jgi:hypothetical protein
MKDHKYLRLSYWKFETNKFVRDEIVEAFDAVGGHVDRLEARIAELEKASGRRGDRAR